MRDAMAVDWSNVVSSLPSSGTYGTEGLPVPGITPDTDWKVLVAGDAFDYLLEGSTTGTSSVLDAMDNETEANATETFSSPYLMPWPQRTSWIVVFSLMLLVATVGNALVAWIVFGSLP